jgi:hypothetical protein
MKTCAARWCVQHGGGRRCPGTAEDDGVCPLEHSVHSSDPYDGQCVNCFVIDHPKDPRAEAARSYVKVREQAVVAVLKKAFPGYNWTFDKAFGRTWVRGRPRPDARARVGTRVILVEIDENSHRCYLCAKEREREAAFVTMSGRESTVVMIRFNPDQYVDYVGKKWPSCFAQFGVNKKQQAQWDNRVQTLIDTIRYVSDPANALPPKQEERPCLMIELFYDNVAGTPEAERLRDARARVCAIRQSKKRLREATTDFAQYDSD